MRQNLIDNTPRPRLCGSELLGSYLSPNEVKKMLPLATMFFMVLFNYTILRNTKDVLIVTDPRSGAETIPFLKTYVLIPGTIVFFALYVRLCAQCSQAAIFYICTIFFLVFFGVFAFILYPIKDIIHPNAFCDYLLEVLPGSFMGPVAMIRLWSFSLFYLMAELWGSVVLSLLFWSFANQVCSVAEAKKFYPLFGMFANVALVVSGNFVTYVAEMRKTMPVEEGVDPWQTSLVYLMSGCLISGGLLLAAFTYMQRCVVNDPNLVEQTQTKKAKSKSNMSMGDSLRYLAKDTYILDLGVLVIGYGMAINLIEVTWKSRLKMQYPEANDYAAFMGKYSTATGMLTIVLMLVGQRFLAWFGWGVTAVCTPVVCLTTGVCFFSLILFPAMWDPVAVSLGVDALLLSVLVGTAQNVGTKATKYGMFDPTKEMAYIPLDAEQKTKGKAAIDVIASRMGKSGGSLIQQFLILFLGTLSACAPYIGIFLLAITLVWIRAVTRLNTQFLALTQKEKTSSIEMRS
jgi:AAA family ATP:ADP antiporter